MGIVEKLNADIIIAMKAREAQKLEALRMVKSALKSKEIDKREPLTEAEAQKILGTLINQRKDSVEQFTKGNRPELAAKEQDEIKLIEAYLPQSASEDEIKALVDGAVAQLTATNGGTKPGPRDMGSVMKLIQAKVAADGIRADGKTISELVKKALNS
ncbi:MAG TPA: GatB/YqeY domain-containing protein [Acidobacteriaceae bacterium]